MVDVKIPTRLELVVEAVPERPALVSLDEVDVGRGVARIEEVMLMTLVPTGTSVVDITVELAGQFGVSGGHDVTVVSSVL
jgi:hypothetical protein